MGITTGVVKIDGYGIKHIGKIEKAHVPWNQSIYTKISGINVLNDGYVKIPYESGYGLYDAYSNVILGGLNSLVDSNNTYVCPKFTQDNDLIWANVAYTVYSVDDVSPANIVKILDSNGQIYLVNGSDGYTHEVVGLFAYRESIDTLTKEHVMFFGYKSEHFNAWYQVDSSDIYCPQIGDTITLYVPTSIDLENYIWSTGLNFDLPKQITYQEYILEYSDFSAAETRGVSPFGTFDLRYLPNLSANLRGYLNGIEVSVCLVDKALATSNADVVIDTSSATYPICDIYWNGLDLASSVFGNIESTDVVRLSCIGMARNKIGSSPFAAILYSIEMG